MKTPRKSLRLNPKKLSLSAPAPVKEYDKDFFKWTKTQANLLKKGNLDKLDIDNLIEEIISLGRSDKRTLRSQITRLLMHLLKQKYQPEKQIDSNSWNDSISSARMEIKYVLEDSPSLKRELIKMYSKAYEDAKSYASDETGLNRKIFPKECPWTLKEIFPDLEKKYW